MLKYGRIVIASITIIAGAFLVPACSRPLEPQTACNFVQNSQFQRVSWKNEKINIYADASVPSPYIESIRLAVSTWNTSLGKSVFQFYATGAPGASYEPVKDSVNKIYWMNTWDASRSSEQARTTVYWVGSNIYEADIRINDYNFDFFTSSESPDYQKVHIESLLIHELGHVLGLAHLQDSTSVMQPNLASGYLRDEPGQVDMSSLKCEY